MKRTQTIDPQVSSYRTFFDHEWSRDFMESVRDTVIEPAGFDLCLGWREAANTHIFPWIMLQSVKNAANSAENERKPRIMQWITLVRDKLGSAIGSSLRAQQRVKLKKALVKLYDDSERAYESIPYAFDVPGLWSDWLSKSEFQLAITGSQRLVYGALYFAYEDFLCRCLREIVGGQVRAHPAKEFGKQIGAHLGQEVRSYCWEEGVPRLARKIRHALVHNGTRVTKELQKEQVGYEHEDGHVVITAAHTSSLFDALKVRATRFAKVSISTIASQPGSASA